MQDEKGPDDHVVCVPCHNPGWNVLADVADLPAQLRAELGHFFSVYKDHDCTRHSKVNGRADRAAALAIISEARARFGRQDTGGLTDSWRHRGAHCGTSTRFGRPGRA